MKKISVIAASAALVASMSAGAQERSILRAIGKAAERQMDIAAASRTHAQLPASEYANSWDSATRSRFQHVIEAPPGRARLTIHARTNAGGGETVAIYPTTAAGGRGGVRIAFVIATTVGNSRSATVTIPRPARNEQFGRLPVTVDVENASGRQLAGEYSIIVEPLD
jgi:hypothetical protein